MSKGPGRVERALEAAFRDNPSSTFAVGELAALAYPGVNQIEKKHRVAVLRSADKVAARLWWEGRRREAKGSEVVYYNLCDVRSMAIGMLRTNYPAYSREVAARDYDNPRRSLRADINEGGYLWLIAERNRATRDGDHEGAAKFQKPLDIETGQRGRLRETLGAALGARRSG